MVGLLVFCLFVGLFVFVLFFESERGKGKEKGSNSKVERVRKNQNESGEEGKQIQDGVLLNLPELHKKIEQVVQS